MGTADEYSVSLIYISFSIIILVISLLIPLYWL